MLSNVATVAIVATVATVANVANIANIANVPRRGRISSPRWRARHRGFLDCLPEDSAREQMKAVLLQDVW